MYECGRGVEALAVCTDVLVLTDEAGGMREALTAHTGGVSGAFYCCVWLRTFNACVAGI